MGSTHINRFTKRKVFHIVEKNGIRFRKKEHLNYLQNMILILKAMNQLCGIIQCQIIHIRKNIIPLLNAISNNEKICLLHKKEKTKIKKYTLFIMIIEIIKLF